MPVLKHDICLSVVLYGESISCLSKERLVKIESIQEKLSDVVSCGFSVSSCSHTTDCTPHMGTLKAIVGF